MLNLTKIFSLKNLFIYIFSYSFITIYYIYIWQLPYWIGTNQQYIYTYYFTEFTKHIGFDFITIFIYIIIGEAVIQLFQYDCIYYKVLIQTCVIIVITGLLFILYKFDLLKNTIFSNWFQYIGMFKILYDLFIILSIYFVMDFLNSQIQ